MELTRGFKDKLEKYVNINQSFSVEMKIKGSAEYDFCCFGVDSAGKLSDDRYMIFYNQTVSPGREITMQNIAEGVQYSLNLSALPLSVQRIVFTASIDGAETMSQIDNFSLTLQQAGGTALGMQLTGQNFADEKAIIAIELYRKDGWKLGCVASGFNGGIAALLRYFGGEEAQEVAPAAPSPVAPPPAAAQRVSLEKRLEREAPHLVSLAKPLKVELKKKNLEELVARVGLVIDISGSMTGRFKNGTVQEIVNKTLPLAVQFDDDGELDFWYYGTRARRMETVNLQNYMNAVPQDWKGLMRDLGGSNNEPEVLRMVLEEYRFSKLPVYVLFITDGGVSKTAEIKKILKEASTAPIFWQFLGVGGSGYGILEKLDTMKGRYVDNAGFFALDDFRQISNEVLYDRLLFEFPKWLQAIRSKGML